MRGIRMQPRKCPSIGLSTNVLEYYKKHVMAEKLPIYFLKGITIGR
jgi:hypothetical protein